MPSKPPHAAKILQSELPGSIAQRMEHPGGRWMKDRIEQRRPKPKQQTWVEQVKAAREEKRKEKKKEAKRKKAEDLRLKSQRDLLVGVIDKCKLVTTKALQCVVRLMDGGNDHEAQCTRRALALTLFRVQDSLSDVDHDRLFTLCRILQRIRDFVEQDRATLLVQIVPFSPEDWKAGSPLHGVTEWLAASSRFARLPPWDCESELWKYAALIEQQHPLSGFQQVIDVKGAPLHADATIKLPLVSMVEGDPVAFHTTTLLHEVAHAAAELRDPLPVVSDSRFHLHAAFASWPTLTLRNAESVALFIRTLTRLLAGNDP